MLDFGPASVDGWLARLADEEIGLAENALLDAANRQIVLGEDRVDLTPLEFSVVQYLDSRRGRVATRQELLADVWGYDFHGGSNVVDAVVRSLRRKLGGQATMLETVRGVGYRLRPDS